MKIAEADIFVRLGGEPIEDLLAYRYETNEDGCEVTANGSNQLFKGSGLSAIFFVKTRLA